MSKQNKCAITKDKDTYESETDDAENELSVRRSQRAEGSNSL